MAGRRGRYPPEYKEELIGLVRSGRSPGSLAGEFEPSERTIRNQVEQADVEEGRRGDGMTTKERIELRRLRRENERPRMEREILNGRVNCDMNMDSSYCWHFDYPRCDSQVALAPDGTVLALARSEVTDLHPALAILSLAEEGRSPLGLATMEGPSSKVRDRGSAERREKGMAGEEQVEMGRWHVFGCGRMVLGRRYSPEVASRLRRSSAHISL